MQGAPELSSQRSTSPQGQVSLDWLAPLLGEDLEGLVRERLFHEEEAVLSLDCPRVVAVLLAQVVSDHAPPILAPGTSPLCESYHLEACQHVHVFAGFLSKFVAYGEQYVLC